MEDPNDFPNIETDLKAGQRAIAGSSVRTHPLNATISQQYMFHPWEEMMICLNNSYPLKTKKRMMGST